ncbi:MAG TPA: cupin domain-containing protein [Steroidobacteraceae bacterium]
MSLKLPALDPRDVTALNSSGYPPEYKARVLPRERRPLGDALGLTKIGVNLTTLEPGKESSMRHWHTHEDELIYVVSGEVVLRTDAGEQTLVAGQCAGFKAGVADGHQFLNRTQTTAVYLAISNRDDLDSAFYPDVDLKYDGSTAKPRFTRKDGTPC